MNNIDENKKIAANLLAAIENGADIQPFFTEDASWWVPEACALSGCYQIQELLAAISEVFSLYKAPPKFTIDYITAEENRVAVFCESHAALLDGTTVHNRYHYLFLFRDGLVCDVKEFMNTAVVNDIMSRIAVLQADKKI